MAQVTVTLNGRHYQLQCGHGEEERVLELAAYAQSKLALLAPPVGHRGAGQERLLVAALLMICDELHDARARLADQHSGGRSRSPRSMPADAMAADADS